MANAGIKFTADGEREFKKALQQITQEYRVLDAQAKLNVAQFEKNDTSVKALKSRNEDLQASIDKQKERIEVLTTAVEKSSDKYGEADTRTLKYREALLKAQTALVGMDKELDKNNAEIKKMTSLSGKVKGALESWKDKVNELKEKHPHLTSALEKTHKAAQSLAKGGLKALGGAAVGAVAGIAAIGAATVKAGKELAGMVKEAAAAGDAIDKNSQKIGVSAEQYQILSFEAERSGTSIQTISKAAAKLKSSGSDLNVDEAIKKIAAIKDPAERSAAAVEMFGAKTAQELAPMLSKGTDGLKEMEKAARDNGMIMSNMSVKAAAAFQDSLTNLKTTATAVKNSIVSELLPGATEVLDGLTGLFSGQEGAAEKVKKGVTDMIASFKTMIPKALEIVKTLAGALLEVAPDIVIALADGIIDNLSPIMDSAMALIEKLTTGLLTDDNVSKVMKASVNLVKSLVHFIAQKIDLILDVSFEIIDALVEGLADPKSMKELVNSTLLIVEKLSTGLIDNLPELLKAAFELAKALAEAIIDYDWWSLAKKIFSSIKGGIKKLLTGNDDSKADTGEGQKKPNGSFAGGLPYVPYDGYTAELHRGERVLTAYEAQTYSTSDTATASEVRALRQELSSMREYIRRNGVSTNVTNWRQGRRELKTT